MSNSKLYFCFLLSAFCFQASAQYSIDWFTVDGGGGTSTGGAYSVSGTIGQPDAGKMSGGIYTLDGGFWGITSAVQTPGAPLLTITRTLTNTVIVSWPFPSTGYSLEQNPTVGPTGWTSVTNVAGNDGAFNSVVLPATPGNRFYRLKK